MIKDLNKNQQELAEYMIELSEEAYYAGWMEGLEYALWKAVVEGPYNYGRLNINKNHIENLQNLSTQCGGWIYFDHLKEESFIDLESWKTKYSENIETYIGKIS